MLNAPDRYAAGVLIDPLTSIIAGDGEPLSTGEDDVASLAIALAALESSRTSQS